jgi:uncharacterized protein (TIGR00269 family)
MKNGSKDFSGKVFKTIEKYSLVKNGDVIFVGLSGGKDSITTLDILLKYKQNNSVNAKIMGFHINLGFDYSYRLEEFILETCRSFRVECVISRVKDYGLDLLKISKIKKRPVCSLCGQVKRYLMNKIPRDHGATKFATGHHVDDFLMFYFKNFIYKNFEWSFKMLPKVKSKNPKLLTKIRPLIFTKSKEILEYATINGLPIFPETCPYSLGGGCLTDPKTIKFVELVESANNIVENFKLEMMHSIVLFNKKYAHLLIEDNSLKSCRICGEPTSGDICSFCRLLEFANKVESRLS